MKKKYKTKMRATSIEAFCHILEHLCESRMKVFKAIKKIQPCYNLQIAKHLNIPINCVTGRVKELRDLGMVRFYKKVICEETGEKADCWIVPAWMMGLMVK